MTKSRNLKSALLITFSLMFCFLFAFASFATTNSTSNQTNTSTGTVTVNVYKNGAVWSNLTDANFNKSGAHVVLQEGTRTVYASSYSKGVYTFKGIPVQTTVIVKAAKNGTSGTLTQTTKIVATTSNTVRVDYYTISLTKGTGISAVSGAGTYLKGTTATVSATASSGYQLPKWSGTLSSSSGSMSFSVAAKKYTLTAAATPKTITVTYTANGGKVKSASHMNSAGTVTYYHALGSDGLLRYSSSKAVTADSAPFKHVYKFGSATFDPVNQSTFGLIRTGYTASEKYRVGQATNAATVSASATKEAAAALDSLILAGQKEVEFYPVWNKATYTITYKWADGTTVSNISTGKYTYGTAYTLPTPPSQTGYTVSGWYTDAACTKKVTTISSTSTENKVFYAKKAPITYKISYYLDGKLVKSDSYQYGAGKATLYSLAPVTGKSNTPATNTAWFTSTQKTSTATSVSKTAIGNKNFYKYSSYITYNIEYNLGGGYFKVAKNSTATSGDLKFHKNPTSAKYIGVKDSGYSKFFSVEKPTRTGYTFVGWKITGMDSCTHRIWYADAEHTLKTTSIANTTEAGQATLFCNLRSTSGTVTFTAVWRANEYHIHYYVVCDGQTKLVEIDEHVYDKEYHVRSVQSICKDEYSSYIPKDGKWHFGSPNGTAYEPLSVVKNLTSANGGYVKFYTTLERHTYTVDYYVLIDGQLKWLTKDIQCVIGQPYTTKNIVSTVNMIDVNRYQLKDSKWHLETVNGTAYAGGATYSNFNSNMMQSIKLVTEVVSLPNPQLIVNPNGGTWNGKTTSQTFVQDPSSTLSIANPTKGKTVKVTFNGNGGTSDKASQSVTLSFRSWTKSSAFSGTFTAGGDISKYVFGPNGSKDILTAVYNPGKVTLPLATRDGYTLLGWAESSTATTAKYKAKVSVSISANKTFYAVWEKTCEHLNQKVETTTQKATCLSGGYKQTVITCTDCNKVLSTTDEKINQIVHTLNDKQEPICYYTIKENEKKGNFTTPASWDETTYCKECGIVVKKIHWTAGAPTHGQTEVITETTPATCISYGYTSYKKVCKDCGAVLSGSTAAIAPIDHGVNSDGMAPCYEIRYDQAKNRYYMYCTECKCEVGEVNYSTHVE